MNQYCLVLSALAVALVGVSSTPLNDSCTVTAFSQVAAAVKSCTNLVINGITVPGGKTLDLPLKDGATLTFKGTIKFEHNIWKGPLIQVSGNRVNVIGTGATLDGQGAQYWDGKGAQNTKPKFFKIKTTGGSKLTNIKLLNCPVQCVSISSTDTVLNGWVIDNKAGDAGQKGHNTDGFDVSSSDHLTVENSVVYNQDDCVAVNQGSNFLFKNLTCSGGHGLSLSVGQSSASGTVNTLKNVTFTDCSVVNSRNGIHVKTHSDAGTGSITDVIYKNIILSGIDYYGVNVQQDYADGKSTKKPTSNIPIKDLVLNNVQGTMTGSSNSMPVYILCGDKGCSGWSWSQVKITNGKKGNDCNFNPSGFSCK